MKILNFFTQLLLLLAASTASMMSFVVVVHSVSAHGDCGPSFSFAPANKAETTSRVMAIRNMSVAEHSFHAPMIETLIFSHFTDYWRYGSSTVISDKYVRLTPQSTSKTGFVTNDVPVQMSEWEVAVGVRIHNSGGSRAAGADGLAFWYTKEQISADGTLLGHPDTFVGLGVLLDTYDNKFGANHVKLMGAYTFPQPHPIRLSPNDDFQDKNQQGGSRQKSCPVNQLRSITPDVDDSHVIFVRYESRKLTVSYQLASAGSDKGAFEECFTMEDIILPSGFYFTLTAATGGIGDNHDITFFYAKPLVGTSKKTFWDHHYDHGDMSYNHNEDKQQKHAWRAKSKEEQDKEARVMDEASDEAIQMKIDMESRLAETKRISDNKRKVRRDRRMFNADLKKNSAAEETARALANELNNNLNKKDDDDEDDDEDDNQNKNEKHQQQQQQHQAVPTPAPTPVAPTPPPPTPEVKPEPPKQEEQPQQQQQQQPQAPPVVQVEEKPQQPKLTEEPPKEPQTAAPVVQEIHQQQPKQPEESPKEPQAAAPVVQEIPQQQPKQPEELPKEPQAAAQVVQEIHQQQQPAATPSPSPAPAPAPASPVELSASHEDEIAKLKAQIERLKLQKELNQLQREHQEDQKQEQQPPPQQQPAPAVVAPVAAPVQVEVTAQPPQQAPVVQTPVPEQQQVQPDPQQASISPAPVAVPVAVPVVDSPTSASLSNSQPEHKEQQQQPQPPVESAKAQSNVAVPAEDGASSGNAENNIKNYKENEPEEGDAAAGGEDDEDEDEEDEDDKLLADTDPAMRTQADIQRAEQATVLDKHARARIQREKARQKQLSKGKPKKKGRKQK